VISTGHHQVEANHRAADLGMLSGHIVELHARV